MDFVNNHAITPTVADKLLRLFKDLLLGHIVQMTSFRLIVVVG